MTAKDDLKIRQAYPLKAKVHLTLQRIHEFYEAKGGMVYVAFSGGKDSQVLGHLVRSIYPDVPFVFSNTGLEYPEIVSHVATFPGVEVVRPKLTFKEVIEKWGFAVISKKVSRQVYDLTHPTARNAATRNLRLTGMTADGRVMKHQQLSAKWMRLVNAPFKVSDQCCASLKKQPMDAYAKASGRVPFMGLMAEESDTRALAYERVGCNVIGTKKDRSTPMAFWTGQDVLRYIVEEGLEIASVYGQIVEDPATGLLKTTGVSRTGCIWCLFGIHFDHTRGRLNRIQMLAVTHPQIHKYAIHKLGIGAVMDFLGFPWAIPAEAPTQPSLFTDEQAS